MQKILGKVLPCIEADIYYPAPLVQSLRNFKFSTAIHFDGLKVVGESVGKPIE